jgi:hypothetical protein
MANVAAAKQFSFRLPEALVEQVDACMAGLRAAGLEVTRAEVVRLLLRHALEATHCKVDVLLRRTNARKRR